MFIPPKLGFDPAPNPVFAEEITNFPTLEPLECWKSPFSGPDSTPTSESNNRSLGCDGCPNGEGWF